MFICTPPLVAPCLKHTVTLKVRSMHSTHHGTARPTRLPNLKPTPLVPPPPTNRTTLLIWNSHRKDRTRRPWAQRQGSGYSRVHPLRRRPFPPFDAQPPQSRCGDHLRPRPWGWGRWTEIAGGAVRRQRRLAESRPARGIGEGRPREGEGTTLFFFSTALDVGSSRAVVWL